jgi:SNF2 family DNA or RNA helicase
VVLLDKLLPKLRQEGHKILVFSQMVKMLDLISEYCEFRDFKYERLDGRIRGSERQKAIDRFEREDDSFLFLLSTRAGGVGINLVSATICILFDRYAPSPDCLVLCSVKLGQSHESFFLVLQ